MLASLFEGDTRVVRRLAALEDPLTHAYAVLQAAPEAEQIEALNAHPRIGEHAGSAVSAHEQGAAAPLSVLTELAAANAAYEAKFGFRFVIFIHGRSQEAVLAVLRTRLGRTRDEELATGLAELVAIATDRARRR